MEYRKLGKAGIKVSEISLGAWLTYGESVDFEVTKKCIYIAIENGINFFDLADVYAKGEAERVVGKILKDFRRQDLVISSKVYWPMSDNVNDRGLSRKHIMESIEGSLKRLGTDYLDIYFCHRFDPETPLEEVVRAMDDLVHQGKILYWGTSLWTAAQIERAVGICEKLNCYKPQVEQPRYNMLDRHIEQEIIPTCSMYGIGITVFSPLAQGVLTGKYNEGIPSKTRAEWSEWIRRDLTEENINKVRKLTELAKDIGITMSQLALAWILRKPEISSVITGASKPEQILENVKASGIKLSEEVLKKIDNILLET
ncbi:MAG: aldo/keto reductase family protein [Dictyoglomus sp.]|nr:aldo/keto reductase family protein [Dictyoglomus sp.]MDW8187969.1 aldo/keto reductase family protein [Dictyoglomus sp.]